jgi:hypothetical protein
MADTLQQAIADFLNSASRASFATDNSVCETCRSAYGDVFMMGEQVFSHSGVKTSSSNGPWVKQTNKFVGLRFIIDGRFHYGWARLTTDTVNGNVLTGYAYETKPGQRILAGQIGGNEADAAFIAPSTLGVLAKGADSRRTETLSSLLDRR